jgi:HAD superfamily hydrolase (TIGR01509 family)
MAHIQWKDRYRIGYKNIDGQHRLLLDILNELIDLVGVRAAPDQVAGIFHRLCDYALTHFKTEEAYMRAARYPGLARHEAQHATFIQRLLELNQTYDPTDPGLVEETLLFLKEWYLNHILQSDLDYVPCLKRFREEAEIKAVIFDFGNVICAFDHARILAALAPACGKSPEDLRELIFGNPQLLTAYESGDIDSAEFRARISALCGHDFPEADFIQAFTDIFTPLETTFELIRQLKPRYKLGLISNTNPWHFEHAIQTAEVFPLFDAVTLSYEVGALKPDPRLFEDSLAKLDLMAEECVFIDDIPTFAQAADACLMHGITYTGPDALRAKLRALGLEA